MEAAPHPWPALGVLLMRDGLVEKGELEEILNEQLDRRQQRLSGRRLGEILVQRGRVTPDQVARLVAEQFELPFVDFDVSDIDFEVAQVLSEDDARRFSAVAISRSPNGVYLLAIAEPSMVLFSDELRRLLGTAPRFAVVGPAALETAIEAIYGGSAAEPPVSTEPGEPGTDDDPDRETVLLRFPASSGSAFELLESRLTEATETRTPPLLGTLLVREGLVTESELDAALAQQRLSPSLRLGEILVDKGVVTPSIVARLVAEQYELPFVELETRNVDHAVANRLPEEVAHRLSAVPVAELEDGSLEVAVADPSTAVRSDELRQALGVALSFVVGSPDAIEALLDRTHTPLPDPALSPVENGAESGDALGIERHLQEEPSGPEAAHEMPSVAFVLDAFAPPWQDEPPFSETTVEVVEAEVEVVEAETGVGDHLEPARTTDPDPVQEPELEPPLVFHVVASAPPEAQPDDAESDWASRLSLVDEVAGPEEGDVADAEVVELVWHSRPVLEAVSDDVVEAEVLELTRTPPQEPQETTVVPEPPSAAAEPTGTADTASFDIFGIETQHETPTVEPDEVPVAVVETVEAVDPPVAGIGALDPPVWDVEVEVADTVVDEVAETLEDEVAETLEDEVADTVERTDAFEAVAAPVWDVEVADTVGDEVADTLEVEVADTVVDEVAETEEEEVADTVVDEVADTVERMDAFEAVAPPVWDVGVEVADTVVDEVAETEEEEVADTVVDEVVELPATVGEVERLVAEALAAGAATLHFSPLDDGVSVRARVDGFARDLGTASHAELDALVARLETDGVGRTHVVTTSRGPKTTVFVREPVGAPTTLDQIGLDDGPATTVRSALADPSGAILVCGPTGSGVTTTLHAMLEKLASGTRIVTAVEDPVERTFDGVDQIEVDPASGVTFASALRELRLADTDVTLVGELEDLSSAELALRSAFAGGLVVAGFRAPGSVEALGRLGDLGVDRALLGGSVTCVVSQRLLRTVCADCHETYYATTEELASLDQPVGGSPRLLVRGGGCAGCGGTGFRGRIGVFEVLPVTEEIRELVAEGASAKKLRKAARAAGMRTLRDEGVRLCLEGATTVAEVERVLGPSA